MEILPIRQAQIADQGAVVECVQKAYALYHSRMDKEPAPLLADYSALITRGVVYVLPGEEGIMGMLVMMPQDRSMFVENIAVDPRFQGKGLGSALMAFVEQQARKEQLDEIRLYTNEVMTENIAFYHTLGFDEVGRWLQGGYRRVFLRKGLV